MRNTVNCFRSRVSSVGARIVFCLGTAVLLALGGCGGESVPEEYSGPPIVAGVVSLDGVPLPGVTVSFENSETGPFQVITGEAGQYSFEDAETAPPLGKYLVRITASAGAAAADSESQTLPARYNSKTELIVDVMSGQNPIDFPLTAASDETEEDGTEE